ncbi:ABC transporter permease [Paenibacillus thiaminolyticus]|uniref:ABC transporter permease n=1 Tax=Paenibacillus thiaminolyticus TaxID=49283 RepID=UPI003D29A18C
MRNVMRLVWRDLLKHRLQVWLMLLLIVATSFIYFFIQYASDGIRTEYERFAGASGQEHFAFRPNLAVLLEGEKLRQLARRESISQQELDSLGLENLIDTGMLRLPDEEAAAAARLSEEYRFYAAEMKYKENVEQGILYRWYDDVSERSVNRIHVVEGRLPADNGEIAFALHADTGQPWKVGDRLTIGDQTYAVTGTAILPEQMRRYATDAERPFHIIVSAKQYERINGKEFHYFSGRFRDGEYKEDVIRQMAEDVRFASFLPAQDNPEATELAKGAASNSGMAVIFLIILTLLCTGVFLIFLNRRLRQQQKSLGCLIALGYPRAQLRKAYVAIHAALCAAGVILGLLLAYFASDLLLQQFQAQYVMPAFPKKLDASSLLTGVLVIMIGFNAASYWMLARIMNGDAAAMLHARQKQEHVNFLTRWVSRATAGLPFIWRVKLQMSVRSLKMIVMLGITVLLSSILFIMGLSLNQSSSIAVEQRFRGVHYQYDIHYAEARISQHDGSRNDYYLQKNKRMAWDDGSGKRAGATVNLLAFDGGNQWLTLSDGSGREMNAKLKEGAIVHVSKAQLYGLQIGSTIKLLFGGKEVAVPIAAFCSNGDPAAVYMDKLQLTKALGISPDIYNASFTHSLGADARQEAGSKVISTESMRKEMQDQASSSQLSAVLNQVIGGVIAVIMVWLVALITVEENKANMAVLRMIGYSDREIANMLLNIYIAIVTVSYCVFTPISLLVVRYILNMVSLNTNDFIPLIYSIYTFVLVLAIILAIYYVVLFAVRRMYVHTFGASPTNM